jgi:hypothetical protein
LRDKFAVTNGDLGEIWRLCHVSPKVICAVSLK